VEELIAAQDSNPRTEYFFELGKMHFQLVKISMSPDDGSETSNNLQRALLNTASDDPARAERERLFNGCFNFLANSIGVDIRGRPTKAQN
jgi:hypothetical protein